LSARRRTKDISLDLAESDNEAEKQKDPGPKGWSANPGIALLFSPHRSMDMLVALPELALHHFENLFWQSLYA
jgi:hypothetical protein